MHLRHGEFILRTVHRHWTPYVIQIIKVLLIAAPVFLVAFFITAILDLETSLLIFAVMAFLFGIVIGVISLDYLLDKLVITNKRVVWINWRSIFTKEERETELVDIQDIDSFEKGLLSKLRIFDYGILEIETAASKTCIIYKDCPDPESLKTFILNQMEKSRGSIHEKKEAPSATEEWSVN